MTNNNIKTLLKKGVKTPEINIVTITPELATILLETNTNNRPLSRQRVRMYADSMKRGQWKVNGEAIKTCTLKDGTTRLLDGQHRLEACVEAGVPFDTLLVSELDENVFSVLDRGKTRAAHDVLAIAGIKSGSHLAPAAKMFIAMEAGLNPRNRDHAMLITSEDVLEYCRKHDEELRWSYSISHRVYNAIGGSRTAWIVFSILVAQERGERNTIEAFMDAMATGEALVSGDPRLSVRNWCIRSGGARTSIPSYDYVATLIRYFNMWVEGKTSTIVRPWTQAAEFPVPSKGQPVYGQYLTN